MKKIIILFLLIISVKISHADFEAVDLEKVIFKQLYQKDEIDRDIYLDSHLNNIVYSKGKVLKIDKVERYKRKFRIIIEFSYSKSKKVTCYIFTNEDFSEFLERDDIFQFKGQLVIYTPLDSKRNKYIFDLILEDGAFLVE